MLRANGRLEDLAYAVARELREDFRTIAAKLLFIEAQLESHGIELAQLILSGVTRMSSSFENLHSSASLGFDDAPQPVNLDHVLTEVLQSLGYIIATNSAVATAAPLPIVNGNDKQLMRVSKT